MDLELAGKVALISGGSRGIGFACARALAAEGAAVVLGARDTSRLRAAEREMRDEGFSEVLAIRADTTDSESVDALVAGAVARFGSVHVLVNAAARPGGGVAAGVLDFDEDLLRLELETKLLGYVRCARAVVPHMRRAGWGRVVNIAGNAAMQTGNVVGSIRNGSVVAMTKNLADELAGTGIGVVGVHPGLTVTERIPAFLASRAAAAGTTVEEAETALAERNTLGRLVRADEVGRVVAFLASPAATPINGETVPANGGMRGVLRI